MNPLIRATVRFVAVLLIGGVLGGVGTYYAIDYASRSASSALIAMANESYASKQYDDAIGMLYGAISKNPDYYAPYYRLGDVFAELGKRDIALRMYRAALERIDNPNPTVFSSYKRAATYDRGLIEARVQQFSKSEPKGPKGSDSN